MLSHTINVRKINQNVFFEYRFLLKLSFPHLICPILIHINHNIAIMLGNMIDTKLIERRISRTDFAKRIKRSRSYVYGILQKDSVETADLLVISKVLGFNFFARYCEKLKHLPPFPEDIPTESVSLTPSEEKIVLLERENQQLRRLVELLEEKVGNKE
jgi:hypothetical protein